jgi:protein TonB
MAHAAAAAPQALHVESSVQAAKRIGGPAPTAPAGSTGVVRLAVVIGKDGNVENIQVVSGPPSLVPPAIEAVRQWVYRPTLIAGEPVEVVTAVNVPFGQ